MIEVLTHITPREHDWLRDPREGLAARCKFLPTPADVFELIREREARTPKATLPRNVLLPDKFDPDADWNKPGEHKRRVVREYLGYNPGEPAPPKPPPIMPDADEVKAIGKSLKTPALPASRELRAMLGMPTEGASTLAELDALRRKATAESA
jgi:hypothetical protein